VKENDVISFTLSGTPKVGKPITATVDKMVFADLLPNETVQWQGFSTPVTGKSITFTPKTPGTLSITSKIKGKGVTQKVNVVEAKISQGFWNDFGGSEISHAAWGQKVDFCVKGENIEGEEIELAIYDSDNVSGDDLGYSNTENKLKITGKNDKTYASHRIEFTKKVKDRTANDLSSEVKLYGKAKLLGFENSPLKDITPVEKTSKYLTVNNEKTVYRAIIGEQNGRARQMPVDYDVISWVYANTTYPKGTKLKIKIFEDINWAIDQECKELFTTGTVGEDGTLAAQINWSKLKNAKQNKKTKKYYAIIYDEKDNELLNGSSSDTLCNTTLIPKSILLKEASYTGAVIVGSEQAPQPNTGTCVCRDYDLIWGGHPNVNCEFRKKVVEICKDLWGEENKIQMANNLMAVFRWESGGTFKPDAPNQADSGGTGLIQFMPNTAAGLLGKKITVENVKNYYGKKYNKKTKQKEDWYLKRVKEFADMTAVQQLDYVKKYFEPLRNKTVEFVDFYLQVLFPVSSRKDDHIVFASSLDKLTTRTNEPEKLRNLRVTAYKQNDGLDTNKDGKIWKSEIKAKVQVYITEGTANKESNFECGKNNDKNNPSEISLCSKDGSQCLDYADVWESPIISSDNGGKNNNRFDKGSSRGHKGVDILSGPIYKEVHSLMCGKVEKIITSFKTNQYGEKKLGNVINIKSKDKNGNIVYILYCHLDKVYVKEGETVKHGQKIALSGSTGNASDGSLPNGVPGRGINKENWHVHIEACSNGSGAATFFGKDRLQPEDYMKTKFDNKGNAIK